MTDITSSRVDGKPRGFTLVELLVVVSIIALLVAILMPALTHARELARRGVCASNLHSVVLSANIYAQADSGGYYPPQYVDKDPDSSLFMYGSLGLYGLLPSTADSFADYGADGKAGGLQCPNYPDYREIGDHTVFIGYMYLGGPVAEEPGVTVRSARGKKVRPDDKKRGWEKYKGIIDGPTNLYEKRGILVSDMVCSQSSNYGMIAHIEGGGGTYELNLAGQPFEATLAGANQGFSDGSVEWKSGMEILEQYGYTTPDMKFWLPHIWPARMVGYANDSSAAWW
jgi:prepilin-type N-terminal cleavage/methylation domain-containing protein